MRPQIFPQVLLWLPALLRAWVESFGLLLLHLLLSHNGDQSALIPRYLLSIMSQANEILRGLAGLQHLASALRREKKPIQRQCHALPSILPATSAMWNH